MSTKITTENGAGFKVGQLGITVVHPEGIATIWARLSLDQRRDLAESLVPGRDFSGVDWRSMYDQARSERDAAVYAYDKAERERDEWKARAEAAEARTTPAVTRAGVKNAIDTCFALAPKINTQVISDAVCDFLGVEAEPADPLLDKAQEFAALADWELADREAELLHKVAAHVLGQEDRHVDQ